MHPSRPPPSPTSRPLSLSPLPPFSSPPAVYPLLGPILCHSRLFLPNSLLLLPSLHSFLLIGPPAGPFEPSVASASRRRVKCASEGRCRHRRRGKRVDWGKGGRRRVLAKSRRTSFGKWMDDALSMSCQHSPIPANSSSTLPIPGPSHASQKDLVELTLVNSPFSSIQRIASHLKCPLLPLPNFRYFFACLIADEAKGCHSRFD